MEWRCADLCSYDEVSGVVGDLGALGCRPLALLVNFAGVYREAKLADFGYDLVRLLVDTNLVGLIDLTRQLLPLLSRGSLIVNVSSMSAKRALPDQAVYAATKAAVDALGKALAAELWADGIRVNTVSPGPARTDILSTFLPPEFIPDVQRLVASLMPTERLVEPDEIASAVEFLIDNPAVNGADDVVDGGFTVSRTPICKTPPPPKGSRLGRRGHPHKRQVRA